MKSETKSKKSVRLLSLLTLIAVLVSGFGISTVYAAMKTPDASKVKLNAAEYNGKLYYAAGDVIQVQGKMTNVAEGSVRARIEVKKSNTKIAEIEDEIPYVHGPNVNMSEFTTLNAELSKISLSAGTYTCTISVGNKKPGERVYKNFDSKGFEFQVISKTGSYKNSYDFVYNHVGDYFKMSKGWRLYNTYLLANRKKKANVIAKEAINSFVSKNSYTTEGFVTKLYNALLYRKPDADGMNYWKGAIDAGMPIADVITWWTTTYYNVEFAVLLQSKSLYH